MEVVAYGAVVVIWMYWLANRLGEKVDIGLGIFLGSLATCLLMRVIWVFITTMRAYQGLG